MVCNYKISSGYQGNLNTRVHKLGQKKRVYFENLVFIQIFKLVQYKIIKRWEWCVAVCCFTAASIIILSLMQKHAPHWGDLKNNGGDGVYCRTSWEVIKSLWRAHLWFWYHCEETGMTGPCWPSWVTVRTSTVIQGPLLSLLLYIQSKPLPLNIPKIPVAQHWLDIHPHILVRGSNFTWSIYSF